MTEKTLSERPYKGLIPYVEEDAPFFFGREVEREIITANLMAARLTLLYGASGVGKTSVLRAGVAYHLWQLARQNLAERGTPEFAVVVFSAWRDDPIAGLVACVQEAVTHTLNVPELEPVSPSPSLTETLQALTERLGGDLLIILDQFEEYFLYHPQEDGEGTFAVEFPRAVNRPDLRASFLISIREDALAKLDRFKGRIPNLFANYLRIEHLDLEGARAAIEKPVDKYNDLQGAGGQPIELEPALVDTVLEQVRTGQVILGQVGRGVVGGETAAQIETPYLQLVMTRLWDEERGTGSRILQLETLKRLGGAARIVRTHLDTAMEKLPLNEQEAAARVFHYLVTPSGAKIAHTISDLSAYTKLPSSELTPVMDKLSGGDVRLLRPVAPPPDRPNEPPRYEIFHDILAPAVLDWQTRYVQEQERAEREREAEEQRRQVKEANKLTKELQFMLSNLLAAQSKILQENYPQYSLLLAIQALNITTEMGEPCIPFAEEALREALTNTGGRGFSGHQDIITCVAISPNNRWLVTGSKDTTVRLWDLTNPIAPPIILCGHSALITAVSISSDNHWLVSGSQDNTARLWDLTDLNAPPRILRGHTYFISAVAISPDNRWIITGSEDSTARLWDFRDPHAESIQSIILSRHEAGIRTLAVSLDNHWLVTGSDDHTACRWDLTASDPNTTSFVLSGHSDSIWNVAISSNNQWIVTAGLAKDKTVRLWDLNNLYAPPRILTEHNEGISTLAISSDNHWLVTGSWDKTVCLWNLWDLPNLNSPSHVLRGHEEWISGVAISADNHYLVTASGDKSVRFWDLSNLDVDPLVMHGHEHIISTVAISSDRHWLVTGSHDRTARLWNLDTPITEPVILSDLRSPIAISQDNPWLAAACKDNNLQLRNLKDLTARPITLNAGREQITAITISPDSHWLVVCSAGHESNTAQLWDLTTLELGNKPFHLRGHIWGIRAVAFSADSRWLVTGSDDHTARLWDLTATDPNANSSVLSRHTDSVCAVAISPNGQWLATGGGDRIAFLWEFTNPPVKRFTLKGHEYKITAIAISHDNRWLATGSEDKTVRLWDLTANDPSLSPVVLSGHIWGIRSIAISTDSHWLVTGSDDKTARLWDLTNPSAAPVVLRGHNAPVWAVAISSDNHWLVTASTDNVRLWNLRLDKLVDLACRTVGRNMTFEEWKKYFSSQKYRKICPNLPVPHSVIK